MKYGKQVLPHLPHTFLCVLLYLPHFPIAVSTDCTLCINNIKDMLARKILNENFLVSLLQPLLSLLTGKINKKVQKVRRILFAGKDR